MPTVKVTKASKAPRAVSPMSLPTGAYVLMHPLLKYCKKLGVAGALDICINVEEHMFAVQKEWCPGYSTTGHFLRDNDRLLTCKEWTVPINTSTGQTTLIHRPCFGPARVFKDGTRVWYRFGEIHRLDGPAITRPDGTEIWIRHGQLDRDPAVGPAVSLPCGYRAWFSYGVLSNPAGPAIVMPRPGKPPRKQYFLHGVRHRADGPAGDDGQNNACHPYYYGGKFHRTDGPARVVYEPAGHGKRKFRLEYYLHGVFHRTGGAAVCVVDHAKRPLLAEWHLYGVRHRRDGPAYREWAPNFASSDTPLVLVREEYYDLGVLHRSGGPAIRTWRSDGTLFSEQWYHMGKLHRDDGPAESKWAPGGGLVSERWFFAGVNHRVGGPAYTDTTTIEYRLAGELHRLDGPAFVRSDGAVSTEVYAVAGANHRTNGPASHNSAGKPRNSIFGKLASQQAVARICKALTPAAPPPAKKRKTE